MCGSGKTFQTCLCGIRGHLVVEQYEWSAGRIMNRCRQKEPCVPAELGAQLDAQRQRCAAIARFCVVAGIRCPERFVRPLVSHMVTIGREMAVKLCREGLVDRAFLYAMLRATFMPRYVFITSRSRSGLNVIFSRGASRSERRLARHEIKEWNALVKEYAQSRRPSDTRRTIDIARSAAVGDYFQPRFPVCEGPQCGKMVGRDVVALKTCRCRVVSTLPSAN